MRWTSIGLVVKAVLQIAQVAVLARLLAPADYGLMALVSVVLGFVGLFSDFGVNSAFVQHQDVSNRQRSTLFWFNLMISVVLMLLLMATSSLIASFFGNEKLGPLLVLSSITFVIGATGVQVRLSAEKSLNFSAVMSIEIVAAVIGFITAVILALLGWGVYSLVISAITVSSLTTILAWIFLAKGWRPQLEFHLGEATPFLKFGMALVFSNLVNQLNRTIDVLLGGRFLATEQMGFYSVPRSLALHVQGIVNPVVTRVAFPLISNTQHDREKVRSIYLQTMNMTSSTNAPIYLLLATFAVEVVQILLGTGWESSVSVLRLLALWGLFRSTLNPVGSLLLGMGRADLALKWNIVLLAVVPPTVWVGSHWGATGMALSLLVSQLLLYVPNWYFLVRPNCGAGFVEYSVATLLPIGLSAAGAMIGLSLINPLSNEYLRLILGGVSAGLCYLILSYYFNRQWTQSMLELTGIARYATRLLGRRQV